MKLEYLFHPFIDVAINSEKQQTDIHGAIPLDISATRKPLYKFCTGEKTPQTENSAE